MPGQPIPSSASPTPAEAFSSRLALIDWSATPLGPRDAWPGELQALARVLPRSAQPMALAWGDDLHFLGNDACAALADTPPNATLGQPLRRAWAAHWPLLQPIVESVLADGAHPAPGRRFELATADGAHRFAFTATALHDDAGRPAGVLFAGVAVAAAPDVAELLCAQRRLAQAEEQLRLATDAAEVGFWDVDPATGVVQWPARVKTMFGHPLDADVTMADFYAALHPGDRERVRAAFEAACDPARRCVYDVEYRTVTPDGGPLRWVAAKGRALFSCGQCVRVLGTAIDVTERHQAQAALQASGQRLRRVFELNPIGMVTGDASGRLVEANDAFLRIVGKTRQELRQGLVRWTEITPPEHLEADRRAVAQAQRDGISAVYEKEYLRPNGSRVPVMLATCLFDGESELLAFVIDITERKRAEEALRQSDRRKDEFLATLAHELRNPLAPLRNAAQLLASPALRLDQLGWIQRLMERQVRHMARLLDDLLDLARISQGKLQLKKERVTLAAIVDPAVEAARPMLDAKRHVLTVSLEEGVALGRLALQADAVRLSQVLSNLLTNAAKYTDAGGRIALRVWREGAELCMSVRDNGIGLPPEAGARIFEMFGQLEAGAARSEGGLGIGLALVAGIVELHGGRVAVASDGPGLGSCFTVRLRLDEALDAPAGADAGEPAHAGFKVLVADDNEDAAQTLALLLSFQGFDTRVALAGLDAVELARQWPADAAVLDIGMPDLDGHAVARALRAMEGGQRMRLIALTGWGQDADRRKSAAAGFDHHLTKPVDVQQLLALLAGERAA